MTYADNSTNMYMKSKVSTYFKIIMVCFIATLITISIWFIGYNNWYWGTIDKSKIMDNVQLAKHTFLNNDIFINNFRVSQHCSLNIYSINDPYISCQLPVTYPSMKNAETCETFLIMDAYYNNGEEKFTERNWCN